MRTMITQQGVHYYWSVIPPILSQTGLNFGKAPSYEKAEQAAQRYCKSAATNVFDDAFNSDSRTHCYAPVGNRLHL